MHHGSDMAMMAIMGATTAVLCPGIILLTRDRICWRRVTPPAPAALCGFLLLHATITVTMAMTSAVLVHVALWALLLSGGIFFWLPLLARGTPTSASARCVYLFIAAPSLDLAAVYVVSMGDQLGGLTMIVSMLPMGVTAMALMWQWALQEERSAQALPGHHDAPDR